MKIYLVGGAVRDELLGLDGFDKDYVVVGGSVDEMLAKGFKSVGKYFPVFLHPKTKAEYALARYERKSGIGYTGFETDIENVSLEQDLARRDLTINAIAKDVETGQIIDPFNGQKDLAQGLLRHISSAFSEDPVRILRIARFAARFKPFGFKIAHSTYQLLKEMVACGEVDYLVSERIWLEIEKTLSYDTPSAFFKVLDACGALAIILPGLKRQGDSHYNSLVFLDNLSINDTIIKWALVCHHLNTEQIRLLCNKIKCPNKYKELALLVINNLSFVQSHLMIKNVADWWAFYQKTDALRRVKRFEKLLLVFQLLDMKIELIKYLHQQLLNIDITILNQKNIANELLNKRLNTIEQNLKYYKTVAQQ